MGRVREVMVIRAPPEAVWDALVDYESRPRWSGRVKEARILEGGPLQEGSRIRLHIDRDRFTATAVEVRRGELLTLLVKGPGFRVNHTYELRMSDDRTELSLTGDYRGFVGPLVVRAMRRSVRRDLSDELGAIKAGAEAGQAG